MRTHDWSATPLGEPDRWPHALKVAVRILLTSRFQMWLGWGPDVLFFYNDAYLPTLGGRHPHALATPTRELWREIWDAIHARASIVYERGEATWDAELPLILERHGYPEETYHTFSYSPLFGDDGGVDGLFCAVSEVTESVLTTRRLAALRALADTIASTRDRESLAAGLSGALARAERDVPFALVYLPGRDGGMQLACASGIAPGHRLAPCAIAPGTPRPWDGGTGRSAYGVHPLASAPDVPTGPWDRPPQHVLIVPLGARASRQDGGYLVAALTPYRPAEQELTGLVELLAGQIGNAFEQLDAFEAEKAERERLSVLFEQTPGFMCVLSGPDLVYTSANRRYRELAGNAALIGLPWHAVLPVRENAELTRELASVYHEACTVVREGARVVLQADVRGQHRIKYFDYAIQPMRDENGAVSALFVSGHDVTAKVLAEQALRLANEHLEKRIAERTHSLEEALAHLQRESKEREAMEAALNQAQRMEAVGQLTGGIAHDFNNLLASMSGSLELIRRRLAQQRYAEVGRYVDIAQASAKRAGALTHRLLAFSQRQTLQPEPTDVNTLVRGMLDLVMRTLGPHVDVRFEADRPVWAVLVDPHQLENALLNLCINAGDAMPDGGRLQIATANVRLNEADAGQALAPGEYVRLSVADTGTGITPDILPRIFEPFFTTKPIGAGSGLGLSMVYGFAQQSGGEVQVRSQPGQGSEFSLFLPREPVASASAHAVQDASSAPARKRILLVDDEAAVRDLLAETLLEAGYTVVQAADAESALRTLEQDGPFDMLVTDVGLPGGMNGRQLAEAARQRRPALPVLFVTGYSEGMVVRNGQLEPGTELITKPFELDELSTRVARLVADSGRA